MKYILRELSNLIGQFESTMVHLLIRSSCYIVTRCTNLVSVHYFLPLGI